MLSKKLSELLHRHKIEDKSKIILHYDDDDIEVVIERDEDVLLY